MPVECEVGCPFCGKTGSLEIRPGYQVECLWCGAEGPKAKNRADAIAAWDGRTAYEAGRADAQAPARSACVFCEGRGGPCKECGEYAAPDSGAPGETALRAILEAIDPLYYDEWCCRFCTGQSGGAGPDDQPDIDHMSWCEYESVRERIAEALAAPAPAAPSDFAAGYALERSGDDGVYGDDEVSIYITHPKKGWIVSGVIFGGDGTLRYEQITLPYTMPNEDIWAEANALYRRLKLLAAALQPDGARTTGAEVQDGG